MKRTRMTVVRTAFLSAVSLIVALGTVSCGGKERPVIREIEDLNNQNVGILTGSRLMELASEFADIKPVYYNSYVDEILSLESGKIDAFLVGEPIAREMLAGREEFTYFPLTSGEPNAFAVAPENRELLEEASAAMQEMKADGTLDALDAKWFGADEDAKVCEEIKPGTRGTLQFGTSSAAGKPMVYVKDKELAGFEIDTALLLAERLGYDVEFTDMEFGALIPSLISGKSDMIGANMAVTAERSESVSFLEPNYYDGIVVVVLAQ